MNKYIKPIKIFLLMLSLSFLLIFAFPIELFKQFWTAAWLLLIIVMFVRPLNDIFPKCKIFSFIMKFRRQLWILIWVFALAHTIGAFIDYMELIWHSKTYLELFFDKYVWNYEKYLFWGMLAWIISFPLLITSNWISTKLLGKNWKTLQRFSYFMFIFTAIHIYLIKKEIWPLIVLWVYIVLFVWAYFVNKNKSKQITKWPKWLCVPCWYVYDENVWDPDGGIAPGTKFEDIPDNWVCPVCWVGKSDFILLDDDLESIDWKIIELNYLTKDVIELKVNLSKDINTLPWQFMKFLFSDSQWEFDRSYSIAQHIWNILTFLIKIKSDWRAGKIWPTLKVWNSLKLSWPFWNFLLQNTINPKVFIATGTGLAPIHYMLKNLPSNIDKVLYFWVQTKDDLFYESVMNDIDGLKINCCLSKQQIEWYHHWRISLEWIDFDVNTEFYICWSQSLTEDMIKYLTGKWFVNIYFEKFL